MSLLTEISSYIVWFAIYSIAGWLYETVICSIAAKKLVKRGFLNGPYCPIYGAGAVCCILLFSDIDNILGLFFAGMVVTSVIEYFTSWAMEKLFSARWWDYSSRRFNLNGRKCLLGSAVFGTMIVLLIKIIHPWVVSLTGCIHPNIIIILASAFAAVFVIDIVLTVLSINRFNEKLAEIHMRAQRAVSDYRMHMESRREDIKNKLQSSVDAIKNCKHTEGINKTGSRLSLHERRILRSFPKFQSTRYNDALKSIREEWKKYIEKKKNEIKSKKNKQSKH